MKPLQKLQSLSCLISPLPESSPIGVILTLALVDVVAVCFPSLPSADLMTRSFPSASAHLLPMFV